jgi:riboflavin kinase/FMN adenylyltransferase
MEVFRDAWERRDLPSRTVLTVGNFDGIHRGQRAILERVALRARQRGLTSAVVSFEPHPRSVLRPDEPLRRLTTEQQRERLVAGCGIDALVSVRFTRDFASTPAESFVRAFLVSRLGVAELVVGSRFSFGRDRRGSLDLLGRLGRELGFEASGVDEVSFDGEAISSTRIRSAIEQGDLEVAGAMLGRPYALAGVVTHGDARGRELGWPTANLALESELVPRHGVYAAGLEWEGSRGPRAGVANVGVRPTVEGPRRRVAEIHLFDFEGDLYGCRVELLLCRRLRDEVRFPSLEALRDQIGRDAQGAREYLGSNPCWNLGAGAQTGRPDASTSSREGELDGQ